MKKLKLTSLFLVLLLVLGTVFSVVPVNAAEGYKEGDVIYLDYSALTSWHTPNGADNGGINSILYVNFNNNTRYVNGEKESVVIGADTSRFNPKKVTQEVEQYVYKYVVTAEDAGAQTLMFWRGSETNLWNNSVELTYEEFSLGKNLVTVTDWDNTGSTGTVSYLDYELEAVLTATPEEAQLGDEVTITLGYAKAIDADVTYTYEIYNNDVKVSDESTYTFTLESKSNRLRGKITAAYADGTVAAEAVAYHNIFLGDFNVVNSEANTLYAHAFIDGGTDAESWVKWSTSNSTYYFYLPSSAKTDSIELFSTFDSDIKFNNVTVPANTPTTVSYSASDNSSAVIGDKTYTVKFMNSGAEAALFINNDFSEADNLWDYLSADKENSSSASASVVDKDGTYEAVGIKKIKGRGNTTWNNSDKKPFNINFNSAVTVGTMQKTKKYSLLANFQDPSFSRNRILYDLGDAVNLRYSCDSRFVDFYVDGVYKGQYQMSQRISAGKNNLITGVDDDGYLTDDGKLKEQFSFLIEIPAPEDFYTETDSGVDVCIKSPDVEGNDYLYEDEVRAYVRELFDEMYTALKNNDPNLNDYVDVDSLAICYLVQEFGKNWDTHSWYLVYEPDENGNYKFYGSPVWDFDNSIGNANGVKNDLNSMNVSDYTQYSGWWCKYKKGSNNFSYLCSQNSTVMDRAKTMWFERFVPAVNTFASNNVDSGEIYSSDVYYNYLYQSAEMNYRLWEMTVDNGWIADHSSLEKASFSFDTMSYTVDSKTTSYDQYTFKGQYDYMSDWLLSRAAWISNEWKDSYVEPTPKALLGDADSDGVVTIADATLVQKVVVKFNMEIDEFTADVDQNGYIDIVDATLIQKYCVKILTDTKIGTYVPIE